MLVQVLAAQPGSDSGCWEAVDDSPSTWGIVTHVEDLEFLVPGLAFVEVPANEIYLFLCYHSSAILSAC